MLESYVQKILLETNYRQITTAPSPALMPGFGYLSGGGIDSVFKPAVVRALGTGETGFGNIGEQVISGLKNQFFDAGDYQAVVVNSPVQIGFGDQAMTIGGMNFVNSDVVFVPTNRTGLLSYSRRSKTVKIDLALMSSKLTTSAVSPGLGQPASPCNNPFSFSNFKQAVTIIVNGAMATTWYANNITNKGITPLKFELKAGGLCGNFYNFEDVDTSQIPNDHDTRLRFVFYALDPEENYNVQVVPVGSTTQAAPISDNQRGDVKEVKKLTAAAITARWNSITPGTDTNARFMNYNPFKAAFDYFFGTDNVASWPFAKYFYKERNVYKLTNRNGSLRKVKIYDQDGELISENPVTLQEFLSELGLSGTQAVIGPTEVNAQSNFYRAILGSICAMQTFTPTDEMLAQVSKLKFNVRNTSAVGFNSTTVTEADVKVLNSSGAEYTTSETTVLEVAESHYFKVNTKRYPIELSHNSEEIKNRILLHIANVHPTYTFTASPPPPARRFGRHFTTSSEEAADPNQPQLFPTPPAPTITATPGMVNDFIELLEKRITIRKNQDVTALGRPGTRATSISAFVDLLQQTTEAYNLFVEMMAALRQYTAIVTPTSSAPVFTGQPRNSTPTFEQVMDMIRQNTDIQSYESIVAELQVKIALNRQMNIETYNLLELVKIFLPDIEELQELKKLTSFDEIERETLPGLEVALFDNALKIELVNAYYDSEDKGKALTAVKNIITTATDIANAPFNITAPTHNNLSSPPEESNISLVPELPAPVNQPFPAEKREMVAESRLYESILRDLMEATAKKQRAAKQPKKIKLTKRQLGAMLNEMFGMDHGSYEIESSIRVALSVVPLTFEELYEELTLDPMYGDQIQSDFAEELLDAVRDMISRGELVKNPATGELQNVPY